MPNLLNQLELNRCPHCNVDRPNLPMAWKTQTDAHSGGSPRLWAVYECTSCGGLVTAAAVQSDGPVTEYYPSGIVIDESIPGAAGEYLKQAINTLHAPAGSVMLSASSVDAMLKEKDYTTESLYSRINKAAEDHLITTEMARWAHDIRLDANDQRHADQQATLPTEADAKKCVDFAKALGEFLFALPARVKRGLAAAEGT
ncbi:hypothetical protein CWI75_04655 [Kineobactrum sediminis]|uniref:DUF4145 domain-containing protein n=1 Tax=Kineobactrum sediminis TaxID=1905677 RepID=A0A2N5Y5F9_9GAMM|nr:DUF4145 domain-containing protein [Kineobactrum sediminis]PLW83644.1 hypothetical protein CWI75_04655 [Kineobactrum sediminis]